MLVRTLGCGRNVKGLYIGEQNVRRHFPRDRQHIELQLGHLHIHCNLSPEFWDGRPELADHRLGAWLFSRVFHGKAHIAPVPIEMVAAGRDSYRIVPVTLPAASSNGLSKTGPPPGVMKAARERTSNPRPGQ